MTVLLPSVSDRCLGLLLCLVFILLYPSYACSQRSDDLRIDSVAVDSVNPSNSSVYTSSRNFFQHTLAVPSYILHWSVWPLGEALKFTEHKFPQLFRGERGKVGIFPEFESGGEAGAAFGALLFHRDLFGTGHRVRGEFLIGSSNFNDFDLEYDIPEIFHESDFIELEGEYFNDPAESLFNGNDQDLDQESRFWLEEGAGWINYHLSLADHLNFVFRSGYRNVTIRQSKFRASDDFFNPFPESLKGNTELLVNVGSIILDFAEGVQRSYLGPRFRLDLRFNKSLNSNRFTYFDYLVEWQQFLPLGFLPNTRRLAFRSRIRRVEPINGRDIPFFELPSLGSSRSLRGFGGDRFRDDGLLLLTLEYRYPMWDFMDVVLFVDEGQVFDRFSDISFGDFHSNYGFGFHLLNSTGVAVRFEMAFSKEASRTILTISPNF